MALQPFLPVPNTRLVDDPARDAVWRRWLEQFANRLSPGGLGPVTSIAVSGANGIGVTGSPITSSGTIALSLGAITPSTISTGSVTTAALTVNGNTTLGDSGTDTLTINASTWTYGNNWNATRAAGVLNAGANDIQRSDVTYSGNASGNSDGRAFYLTSVASGANNLSTVRALRVDNTISTSAGSITTAQGLVVVNTLSGAGTVVTWQGLAFALTLNNSGGITNYRGMEVAAPSITSTGTVGTFNAFLCNNVGNATFNNAVGYHVNNFTAALTLTIAFRSQMNSGTGKWGFYADGTANNAFSGDVRIGSTVAPTVALDVTGFGIFTGNVSAAAFIPTSSAVPRAGMYLSAADEVSWSTVSTKGLTLTSTRSLYGTALHNNAGPVTGTANQYIVSGTYTPTTTNVANLDASTSYPAQWTRVGNVVTVSGKVQIDPTAPTVATQLGLSLPIASNLANQEDCAGTAFAPGIAGQGAAILADAGNDRAQMEWIAGDLTVQPMYYVYQYEVL